MDNISIYDLPSTPQTLPCGDEDPFFIFHEDGSIDNDSVGVEIGGSNAIGGRNNCDQEASSSSSNFLPTSRQTKERYIYDIVGKELNFEEPASKTTVQKQQKCNDEDSIRSNRTLPVHISMKNKRRLYRSKFLSGSKLSNMIKTAIQSPSKKFELRDEYSRHLTNRTSLRDKNKMYYSLEDDDDEEDPMGPNNDCDDDRSSCHSLPARLMTSLHRKKKSAAAADSSSTTSSLSLPRESKKKWNRMLQMDSLASFKVPESSPSSITVSSAAAKAEKPSRAMAAEELSMSSSWSTASSTTSWNSCPTVIRSVDNGDDNRRFMTQSHRLTSMLQKGLYSSRVDEEEDEDTDIEEDDHPVAGSFAYAIGRRVG